MTENPLQLLFEAFHKVSACVQTGLSHFLVRPQNSKTPTNHSKLVAIDHHDLLQQPRQTLHKGESSGPITKEELGRATWTFLHTLAAQYPDKPTRQQRKDVKELMAILSRIYPCQECADHFKDVVRTNPVRAGSHDEFSQWMCQVHNVVNRSLGKLKFPCERVDARWGKLECEQRACDLQGSSSSMIFGFENK